jgi:hypothetical protein
MPMTLPCGCELLGSGVQVPILCAEHERERETLLRAVIILERERQRDREVER